MIVAMLGGTSRTARAARLAAKACFAVGALVWLGHGLAPATLATEVGRDHLAPLPGWLGPALVAALLPALARPVMWGASLASRRRWLAVLVGATTGLALGALQLSAEPQLGPSAVASLVGLAAIMGLVPALGTHAFASSLGRRRPSLLASVTLGLSLLALASALVAPLSVSAPSSTRQRTVIGRIEGLETEGDMALPDESADQGADRHGEQRRGARFVHHRCANRRCELWLTNVHNSSPPLERSRIAKARPGAITISLDGRGHVCIDDGASTTNLSRMTGESLPISLREQLEGTELPWSTRLSPLAGAAIAAALLVARRRQMRLVRQLEGAEGARVHGSSLSLGRAQHRLSTPLPQGNVTLLRLDMGAESYRSDGRVQAEAVSGRPAQLLAKAWADVALLDATAALVAVLGAAPLVLYRL